LPTATPISPSAEVHLSVDKNPISPGDSVTFSIATNLPHRNQPYSFAVDFGDGSQPIRITGNSVPHIFKVSGNYTASVTLLDDGSQARANLAILVDAKRPSRLWAYMLVALAVVALAYLVYAKSKSKIAMAARPTFYAHSDWDAPQTAPKNLGIKYELRFKSNVSAGQDRVETHGSNLIQQRRKQ
jgi:hypothetical protein